MCGNEPQQIQCMSDHSNFRESIFPQSKLCQVLLNVCWRLLILFLIKFVRKIKEALLSNINQGDIFSYMFSFVFFNFSESTCEKCLSVVQSCHEFRNWKWKYFFFSAIQWPKEIRKGFDENIQIFYHLLCSFVMDAEKYKIVIIIMRSTQCYVYYWIMIKTLLRKLYQCKVYTLIGLFNIIIF